MHQSTVLVSELFIKKTCDLTDYKQRHDIKTCIEEDLKERHKANSV